MLSSLIEGKTEDNERVCYIWQGAGSNSKSCLKRLLRETLGDYGTKISNRVDRFALLKARRRRVYDLGEPNVNETINVGLMKLLSDESISVRPLYMAPVKFRLEGKCVVCTNDGIIDKKEKSKIIKFRSNFVMNPDPNNTLEITRNCLLYQRFDQWKPLFMFLLIHYYPYYRRQGV
jgi:hypothetical protein